MKRLGLLLLLLFMNAGVHAQIVLDAPLGGWKHSGGESAQHMQDVNYPASRVNAGAPRVNEDGETVGSSIRGRILSGISKAAKAASPSDDDAGDDEATNPGRRPSKTRQPHLLVVNGVPLPLSTGEDGHFARPYSFPPGANSVEVKSADRKAVRRVSFYDANSARQRVDLRVVLSWDSDMTDLDLHVVSPDGQHVFYGTRTAANGGALDVDVTDGYGPEIYAIPSPPKGLWHVYVNYYGSGDQQDDLTVAQVALIMHEGTVDEKIQTFRVPMRRPGELTLIKSFLYP